MKKVNKENKKPEKLKFREFFSNTIKIFRLIYNKKKITIILVILLSLIIVFLNYIAQKYLSDIITLIVKNKNIDENFIKNSIFLGIFLLLPNILDVLKTMISNINFIEVNKKLDFLFLLKKAGLDIQIQDDPENKDMLARVKDQSSNRIISFIDRIEYVFEEGFYIIISLSVLLFYNWKLCLFVMIFTLPELFTSFKFSGLIYKIFYNSSKSRKLYWSVKNYFSETPELSEISIFKNKNYFFRKIEEYYKRVNSKIVKAERRATIARLISSTLSRLAIIFSIIFVAYNIISKNTDIGIITFIFYSITTFRSSLSEFFRMVSKSYEDSLYIKDFIKFIELENVIKVKKGSFNLNSEESYKIEFKNVSFKYPKTQKYVLKNLNLEILPGEKLAIIGENGAGKSTFIKLLLRFYDVTSGEILINGVDIKDINLKTYYDQLTILLQDFVRYESFNIKESIAIGRINKKINFRKVLEAAKKSGAHNFIKTYKYKYDTCLGRVVDESEQPSGGQWQKLALARVFYRDSNIWILDEPTSAIDAKAECEIFNRLEKVKNKTLIFISHRFSTVRKADKICVMSKGKITEHGTHQELMNLNKLYKKLFDLQAKEYIKK